MQWKDIKEISLYKTVIDATFARHNSYSKTTVFSSLFLIKKFFYLIKNPNV